VIQQDESPKTISVSDFKARCTEVLRSVEKEGITLAVTRHGKVIAIIRKPEASSPSLQEWIGSGAGLMSPEAVASFDEPTWTPEEWEEFPSDSNDDPLV
jgi:prevent-host-death family protein